MRVLLTSKRGEESPEAGCGGLIVIMVVFITTCFPDGTLSLFSYTFLSLVIAMTIVTVIFDYYTNVSNIIYRKSKRQFDDKFKLSTEACLVFLAFQQNIVGFNYEIFDKKTTNSTAKLIKGKLVEFEALYAQLIIEEERINNKISLQLEIDSSSQELEKILVKIYQAEDDSNKTHLIARRDALTSQLESLKHISSIEKRIVNQRLLIDDTIQELFAGLISMDLNVSSNLSKAEEIINLKLAQAKEEFEIMKEAISKVNQNLPQI